MSDLIITVEGRGEPWLVGLLEGDTLLEYHRFSRTEKPLLQSVIQGQLSDRLGNLHSYIVQLHLDKPGFLNVDPSAGLKLGTLRPVQILQEGAGDKGYRVSDRYSLSGRSLVLTPFSPKTSISSKLDPEAVKRRFNALRERFPDGSSCGWIFRTRAADLSDEQILAEAKSLYERHQAIQERKETAPLGTVLDRPELPILAYLLSQPSDLKKIVCEDKETARFLRECLEERDPELADKVETFDQGRWTIRDFYRLTSQLMEAVSRKVLLRDGISIVIDETEALVAIDVNSGSFDRGPDRESLILEANRRAADEILHQIRLRNLSGILIVDFIDMKEERSREQLLRHMKEGAKKDRQKLTVHDITKLGLMELTRQREKLPLSSFLNKNSI